MNLIAFLTKKKNILNEKTTSPLKNVNKSHDGKCIQTEIYIL